MSRPQAPRRGDILRVSFDPQAGHEQAGFRPALVISNSLYNEHSSTIVVCPVTHRVRDWPFEVILPEGLPIAGAILVDQIKVIDWRARGGRHVCVCPQGILDEVQAKLDVLFTGVSRLT